MRAKVALVACGSYSAGEVQRQLGRALELLGGAGRFVKAGQRVLLKPNLCLPQAPERALTTHPEIIRQLAYWFGLTGARVVVGDNPVGDATQDRLDVIWNECGMQEALKDIPYTRSLLNKNMREFKIHIDGTSYSYFVSQEVLDCEAVVNVPKFKTHSLMTFTGAVKNLYGLLPANSKKTLHYQLPEHDKFAEMLVSIYSTVKPALHVMDAVVGIEGDGPGTKGEPRHIGLLMASTDGIALDAVATRIMGLGASRIPTSAAAVRLAAGEVDPENIEIVGDDLDVFIQTDYKIPETSVYHKDLTKKLFRLSKSFIRINQDKCHRCGLCAANCPTSVIDVKEGRYSIRLEVCIGCMTCHEICPAAAVETERPLIYQQLKDLKLRNLQKREMT
jgi:uncharacterized protein (DUF362 family)